MQQQDQPQCGEQQQQQLFHAIADADTTQRGQRPDECSVCLHVYDELDRRPRTLPCGHTYCSVCVSVLLEDGHLTCPSCRTDHCAPEVNHFPISYTVEAVVKVMRTLQAKAASQDRGEALHDTGKATQLTPNSSQATGTKTKRKEAAGLSRKLRSMIQEQKESIKNLGTTLQREVEQLNQYRAKLAVSRAEHTHLLEELDTVVKQHKANLDLLQDEDTKVEGFVAEGQETQKELKTAQVQLDQVITTQEAITTIDAADHTIGEAEEWLQHTRKKIPNGTLLRISFMLQEATKAALKVITQEGGGTPHLVTAGHTNCTIMEAVDIAQGGPVEVADLHTKRLTKHMKAGRVFAIQKNAGGICCSSVVTYKEDKIYLHSLKNVSPPRLALTLLVSKALENIAYPGISVFMDLAWPGYTYRVYIKLVADTPLTRQFVNLCMGHNSLAYCNTNLLTEDRYIRSKIIWGGDIKGQEAVAKQVLPPIQISECGSKVVVTPGMVVARTDLYDAAKSIQFGIVLNDCNYYTPNNPPLYHLGSVDADGQGVVQRAAEARCGLTQVTVVDCGVVY